METPLQGELSGDGDGGSPIPAPNEGGPKPHLECTWLAPYNLDDICGGDPPMSLDFETGLLTAIPDIAGASFVFAIAVDEYRDGELISTTRREIQLESTICDLPIPPVFVGFDPIDTVQVYPIVDNTVNIVVEASGSSVNASAISEILVPGFEPLATIDTVSIVEGSTTLQLLWDSIPCDFVGDIFLIELYAESYSECIDSILTNTMDLYVEIIVDPNVNTVYNSPVVTSYDIIYGMEGTYQFPVVVVDGNPTDTLTLSMITDINGTNPIQFLGDTANNVVSSDFLWEITCNDIQDEPYQVTFQTIATYCNVQDTTLFFMDLNVMMPTDDSTEYVLPQSDIQQWSINGESQCFTVMAEDGNNIDTLFLSVDRSAYPFQASNAATFTDVTSIFEVQSEFCWTPECVDLEPGVYNVDFTVITKNCEIIEYSYKTVEINLFPETYGELDTIPNVFTPNDDAMNDQYEIIYTPDYCVSDYELNIFNRWGRSVFTTNNRDEHWDGKINGDNASEGVYYMVVTYKWYDEPKKFTESLHLFRE